MKIEKTLNDINLSRETTKSKHRPLVRRLLDLTNEELALLLKLRADKVTLSGFKEMRFDEYGKVIRDDG